MEGKHVFFEMNKAIRLRLFYSHESLSHENLLVSLASQLYAATRRYASLRISRMAQLQRVENTKLSARTAREGLRIAKQGKILEGQAAADDVILEFFFFFLGGVFVGVLLCSVLFLFCLAGLVGCLFNLVLCFLSLFWCHNL